MQGVNIFWLVGWLVRLGSSDSHNQPNPEKTLEKMGGWGVRPPEMWMEGRFRQANIARARLLKASNPLGGSSLGFAGV